MRRRRYSSYSYDTGADIIYPGDIDTPGKESLKETAVFAQ